jgi:hypothetical protein
MSTATKEAPQVDVGHNREYLDLEVPIREVTCMAGIARDLAYELLDLECKRKRNEDDEDIIRMSKRECEQFFFAIEDVHDRAEALKKLYYAE